MDLLTGIGPSGAKIDDSRTKPVSGNAFGLVTDYLHVNELMETMCGGGRLTELNSVSAKRIQLRDVFGPHEEADCLP